MLVFKYVSKVLKVYKVGCSIDRNFMIFTFMETSPTTAIELCFLPFLAINAPFMF